MPGDSTSGRLSDLVSQAVVIDMRSTYICLGTLTRADQEFVELADADVHDLRDGRANRETYAYESKRFGIRRNRALVLISREDIVAIARLADILEC